MKIGVLRFPGTNCDRDVVAFVEAKAHQAKYLWHLDQFSTNEVEALILPGGFSYGDYLRSGALASRAPAMKSVRDFAQKGKPILGICNGFQILTESGLLPGALVKNLGMRFVDDWVSLEIINKSQFWARELEGSISLPIAHGDGRFYSSEDDLKRIEDQGQVWLRYRDFNPNGSVHGIAGVMNSERNIVGLMPHPERALWDWMGGTDGWGFL